MKYYVLSSKSPKALAVYDFLEYDEACDEALMTFGEDVIVVDEELYRLECPKVSTE